MIEIEQALTNTDTYGSGLALFMNKTLSSWGISGNSMPFVKLAIQLTVIVALVALLLWVADRLIRFLIIRAYKITNIPILNYMVVNKLPRYLGLLAPYTLVRSTIPIIFKDFPGWIVPLVKAADIYLVLLVVWATSAVIKSFFNALQEKPAFASKPMNSYVQVITIILYGLGMVAIFTIITDRSAVAIFTTLGAASAVTMLVFQDSIKGFVGSIQMAANNMVELGDWITMNKYGADGDVLEVSLNTVKVQNFDKTITTIPTYALISDSFQNWRGMQESGGRRAKKSIFIKQGTIRFMTEQELEKFRQIDYLNKVIKNKEEQYKELDRQLIDNCVPVTNNDLFMAYAMHYLKNHQEVSKELTLLVRQLAPGDKGIPVELYFFTATTVWADYERISTDVMNHLLGMVSVFDLKVFEVLSDTKEMNNPNLLS